MFGDISQSGSAAGDFSDPAYEFLRPIVTGWIGKLNNAIEAKKPFTAVAEQCMAFFAGSTGFMWDPKFQSQFLKGKLSPKFKMTLCKAFELVALFGPTLYWKNPQRRVMPRRPLDLLPDLFGAQNDPMAQFMYQQAMQEEQSRNSEANIRAQLMERYLNYTPIEQPGDGLASHAEMAITEALVKGRGCLWVEPYRMPGSNRMLTGSFYDSVDNLYIDPDAESLEDAMWIAKRCIAPYWVVEREFGYPEGFLKNKASIASSNAQGEIQGDDLKRLNTKTGKTFDLLPYFKIWSKGGIGTRLSGVNTQLKGAFDRVVGDYAYIVVAPNIPFPLNGQSGKVRDASEGDVRKMFKWPADYWADARWPVAILDFYRKPRSVWPIAPLAPGLGELIFLNIITSHLANRIWSSSRDLIAVLKSAAKNVKSHIENGDDQVVFELEDINKNINEVIQFLQQPQTNLDAWQIMDRMADQFNKRVGLNELLYGMNPGGVQSRTAEDISTKREMATIRIDYMSGKVEKWMTEDARMEKLAARWFVLGDDVRPQFGNVGAYLWDRYISGQDPEAVLRELDCTVEAGSIRKPNKQREADNMHQLVPVLAPQLMTYAQGTGDTGPLNHLNELLGESIDQDMSGLKMGPFAPPPPPPDAPPPPEVIEAQTEQQRMQFEGQKMGLELQMKKLDLIMKQLEASAKQGELSAGESQRQAELAAEQIQSQMEMYQDAQRATQELQIDQSRSQQELRQSALEHLLKMKQMKEQGALQISLAKQAAKAKPKPAAKSGSKT